MNEVEKFLQNRSYLTRADISKVLPIDFRRFQDLYAKASRVNDKRISKKKIDIIVIPGNKRNKELFKKEDVIEFLSYHGVYLRTELKKSKSLV